jgi:hypothetical protein
LGETICGGADAAIRERDGLRIRIHATDLLISSGNGADRDRFPPRYVQSCERYSQTPDATAVVSDVSLSTTCRAAANSVTLRHRYLTTAAERSASITIAARIFIMMLFEASELAGALDARLCH